MNSFIKKFIEKNISLIEAEKWDEVFLNWYNSAGEIWPDADIFHEFIDTLNSVNIKPNMFSTYHVLYDELVWIMENAKKVAVNTGDRHHVGRFSMLHKLNSQLGHDVEQVHKIMDDVASSLGMHYSDYYGGGYAW